MTLEAKIRSVLAVCNVFKKLVCHDSDFHCRHYPSIHRLSLQLRSVTWSTWAIISVIRRRDRYPCGTVAVTNGTWRARHAYGMPTTRAGSGHRRVLPIVARRVASRRAYVGSIVTSCRVNGRAVVTSDVQRVTRWG